MLWIGALAQMFGNAALFLARELPFLQGPLAAFATWARAFTAYFHLDISIFIAITFPIAFLTTTARPDRKKLAWTDVVLAAASFAVALYYIVLQRPLPALEPRLLAAQRRRPDRRLRAASRS